MTAIAGFSRKLRRLATFVVAVSLLVGMAFGQQIINGITADGALYQFIVPNPWNGQLVVYSHGYVDPTAPIALPSSPLEVAAIHIIASQGFAVAYSSYAENGWAVKNGAQTTHQLRGLFASKVGTPVRTYLVGTSEGGLISLNLAERFASQYDGALSLCGVVGGATTQFHHLGDGRVLFDYFFPGVLPGDLLHTPNLDFSPGSPTNTAVTNALIAGLFAPGQPTLQFASVARLPGTNLGEVLFSGVSLVGGYLAFNELLHRTNGHNFYDNSQTIYSGSLNDAALNSNVQRFTADPAGRNYLSRYYDPTGLLGFPVLTIHTTEDQSVDFSQEAQYAGEVAAALDSGLLVQQSVNRFGHCNFKLGELENAFQGLVLWVNLGIKPPSGDVTIP